MLDLLLRIANLCRKELLAILKDPSSRVVLFAPAIMQSLLFGYGATYDLRDVPFAVLDARGPAATELVARLEGGGIFRRVATLRNTDDIATVIDREQALMVIVFPPDFERRLSGGGTVAVQLVLDARNSNTAGSAAAAVGTVVEGFNAGLRARAGAPPAALTVQSRAWFNPNLQTRWNLLPGMIAALSMLQTLLLSALSVAREREQGTFDQLLVTPMTPMEIMAGKALPAMAVGLAQSTLVLLVARLWFQIPMAGSLLTLYLGLAFFTLASVGIGLSISAVSAHMQQAMLYAFVLLMPMMLLSGLTTPVSNMPEPLQWLTLANPLRFAIDLVQRVYLEGVGLGTVALDLLPLAVIAAVTLPLAAWLFRHKLA